jgi:hypothetical protein
VPIKSAEAFLVGERYLTISAHDLWLPTYVIDGPTSTVAVYSARYLARLLWRFRIHRIVIQQFLPLEKPKASLVLPLRPAVAH